jgi:nitrate reductase beta subunit
MVFHLDKCIGCHTCSIACKNIWTDRKGTEYMWWNNVETKPGTGYPTTWENQNKYKGGWVKDGDRLRLRLQGRTEGLGNIFFNPNLPTIDDYYEPWTYQYDELFNAPEGDDQPTARPISLITGKPMDIEAGPNWDDDLGGSPVYASNDVNLEKLTDHEREQLNEVERLVFFYLPRDLQARRGRDRPDQSGKVPRLAHVRFRVPVQEDVLQLVHGQIREVHPVLPAPRNGSGTGVLPLLRRAHSVSGPGAV